MSTAAKLAGLAAVLGLFFGAAAVAGSAIGPDRGGDGAGPRESRHSDANPSRGVHGATEEGPVPRHASATSEATGADAVRGLAVSDNGLTLALAPTALVRGRATELRFAIVGSDGQRVRDFEVEHEKRMHLIIVRRDGQGFQHRHPQLGADGIWRIGLTLPRAGAYRVFADFKRDGQARTLAADVVVDGRADYQSLPAPHNSADTGDGYEVRLDAGRVRAGRDAELRFTVTRDGQAVRTEPYLGAGGHLVALRAGDLAYLHVHPGGDGEPGADDDAVSFTSRFPSPGRYRLYLQFKHERRIHTAELTQAVGP